MSDGRRWKEKTSNQNWGLKSLVVGVVGAVKAVKILSDKAGRAEPWLALNLGGHGSSDILLVPKTDLQRKKQRLTQVREWNYGKMKTDPRKQAGRSQ